MRDLVVEADLENKEKLFHPHLRQGQPGDKHIRKKLRSGLAGHEERRQAISDDHAAVVPPVRYSLRSFDRQWIIPDARVINQPNPTLWNPYSLRQVFLTALDAHSPTSGPAVTLTGLIPDLDHYKGSFGGRVFPLWRDSAAKEPNVRPELLAYCAAEIGIPVSAEDVMAYLAAVMAHPAFTARFRDELVRPGLRVPLTADSKLFCEAAELGREVVWLHCYGERFADPAARRPKAPPRLPPERSPTIPADGAIPSSSLPDAMDHDPATKRLRIGEGHVDNVTKEMFDYEVSGKNVLRQWFSYRRRDRTKPIIGNRRPPSPLSEIQPDGWLPEYTTDLLNLLHVLGRLIDLEPQQADVLARICDGPLITVGKLQESGVLEVPDDEVM